MLFKYVAIGAGLLGMVSFLITAWSLWSRGQGKDKRGRGDLTRSGAKGAQHPGGAAQAGAGGDGDGDGRTMLVDMGQVDPGLDLAAGPGQSQRTAFVDMGELQAPQPDQNTAFVDMNEYVDDSQQTNFLPHEVPGPGVDATVIEMAPDGFGEDDGPGNTLLLDDLMAPPASSETMILMDDPVGSPRPGPAAAPAPGRPAGNPRARRRPAPTFRRAGGEGAAQSPSPAPAPIAPAPVAPTPAPVAPAPSPAAASPSKRAQGGSGLRRAPVAAPAPARAPAPAPVPTPRPPASLARPAVGALSTAAASGAAPVVPSMFRPKASAPNPRPSLGPSARPRISVPASAETDEIDDAEFDAFAETEAVEEADDFEEGDKDAFEGDEFGEEGDDEFDDLEEAEEDDDDPFGEEAPETLMVHQSELLEVMQKARREKDEGAG